MVLDDSHLDQFAEEGYVVVRDLLDWDLDLQPVQDEYDEILDRLITKWHADGRLSSTYAGRPWFPGFVVRSAAHPEMELHDADAGAASWRAARSTLAAGGNVEFNRWKEADPRCA